MITDAKPEAPRAHDTTRADLARKARDLAGDASMLAAAMHATGGCEAAAVEALVAASVLARCARLLEPGAGPAR